MKVLKIAAGVILFLVALQALALFASGGVRGRFVEQMLTQAKVP